MEKGKTTDIARYQDFGEAAWHFISAIYEANWDLLSINKDNISFRVKVSNKFTPKLLDINSGLTSGKKKGKVVEIIKLSPISVCLPKKVLENFFSKDKSSTSKANLNTRKSYVQVTNPKVLDIIKLK